VSGTKDHYEHGVTPTGTPEKCYFLTNDARPIVNYTDSFP